MGKIEEQEGVEEDEFVEILDYRNSMNLVIFLLK